MLPKWMSTQLGQCHRQGKPFMVTAQKPCPLAESRVRPQGIGIFQGLNSLNEPSRLLFVGGRIVLCQRIVNEET